MAGINIMKPYTFMLPNISEELISILFSYVNNDDTDMKEYNKRLFISKISTMDIIKLYLFTKVLNNRVDDIYIISEKQHILDNLIIDIINTELSDVDYLEYYNDKTANSILSISNELSIRHINNYNILIFNDEYVNYLIKKSNNNKLTYVYNDIYDVTIKHFYEEVHLTSDVPSVNKGMFYLMNKFMSLK